MPGGSKDVASHERLRRVIARTGKAVTASADPDVRVTIANVRGIYAAQIGEMYDALEKALNDGIRRGYEKAGLLPDLRLVKAERLPFPAERAIELTRQLADEQRRVLSWATREAVKRQFTPEQRQQWLSDVAGLAKRDAEALLRYRDKLKALGIRNKWIQSRTTKLANRYLAQRAQRIAFQQTQIAYNLGQREVWLAAKNNGFFRGRVFRRWVVHETERTCKVCMALNGQTVMLDEPYRTADGVAAEPGQVHPYCACSEDLIGG